MSRARSYSYEEMANMTIAQMFSVIRTPAEGKVGIVSGEEGAEIRARLATARERFLDAECAKWQPTNLN